MNRQDANLLTGTAGVSPAFVECHVVGLPGSIVCRMNALLEAGETPAVPVTR